MKAFWKLFFHAIPLGIGIVLSLISIVYISKIGSIDEIAASIIFGIIGFPMVIAGATRFIKKVNEE